MVPHNKFFLSVTVDITFVPPSKWAITPLEIVSFVNYPSEIVQH